VVVSNGASVTVDTAAVCASLAFVADGSSSTVTINSSKSLTVTGAITFNASTAGSNTRYLNVGSGTLSAGSVALGSPSDSKSRGSAHDRYGYGHDFRAYRRRTTTGTAGRIHLVRLPDNRRNHGVALHVHSVVRTVTYNGAGDQNRRGILITRSDSFGGGIATLAGSTTVSGVLTPSPPARPGSGLFPRPHSHRAFNISEPIRIAAQTGADFRD